MPPPHPDQHSPRGNFWDCVSIPPGWEWCQGVNEGTLGRAGIAADRCWPGAFLGFLVAVSSGCCGTFAVRWDGCHGEGARVL